MNERSDNVELEYLNLKRVSTIGLLAVLVWFSLVGGVIMLLSKDTFGWVSLGIGIVLLLIPLSSPFRRYWGMGNSARVFPVIVFAANLGLIIMYGSVLLAYLSDPFVFYNDQNTIAVLLWAGATVLSVLAFLANVVALIMDRRRLSRQLA